MRRLKSVLAFFVSYIFSITLIVLYNNSLQIFGFCGSIGDFHDGPVASVCLSFPEYWMMAATYPQYMMLSAVLSLVIALSYYARLGDFLKKRVRSYG